MALNASLVGAKKVSAPCWFSNSVIPAVWMAPTRRLKPRNTAADQDVTSLEATVIVTTMLTANVIMQSAVSTLMLS